MRLQRFLVTAAIASGAGLIGVAAGGIANVDRELRAVSPAPRMLATQAGADAEGRRCLRPAPRDAREL
jgi:uncharacterized membrane protein